MHHLLLLCNTGVVHKHVTHGALPILCISYFCVVQGNILVRYHWNIVHFRVLHQNPQTKTFLSLSYSFLVTLDNSFSLSLLFVYLQMAVGIAAVSQAYFLMRSGRQCNTTFSHLYVSFGIYGSYFLLFGHFFYKSYMGRGRKTAVNGVKKIE